VAQAATRQIGDLGVIIVKDFGSGTLDASRDQGRDVGVLREVYDGSWIRHIGSDGGRTLHWYGKVGLVSPALG
jgi:hypothetical protein